MQRVRCLTLLVGLAMAGTMQAGQFELSTSGSVEASGSGSSADEGLNAEYSTFGGDATNSEGPYEISLALDEARVFDAPGGVSVTLTMNGPLEPGEYRIQDNTNDDAAVTGVVYVDQEDRRLAFSRATFAAGGEGTLTLERFDRDVATGTFEFTGANAAEPPETVKVSGSFTDLAYAYDTEIEVTGTGPFASMRTPFNEASAAAQGRMVRVALSKQWGPDLVFTVPAPVEKGAVTLGPGGPGAVTWDDKAGRGKLTVTRAGDKIGGEFEVEVSHKGSTGTLSGRFDYLSVGQ